MKLHSIAILILLPWCVHSGVAAPTHLVDEAPISVKRLTPDVVLVDFGRVSFGNLRLTPPSEDTMKITVHFGESLESGRINRKPPGTVRHTFTAPDLSGGKARW